MIYLYNQLGYYYDQFTEGHFNCIYILIKRPILIKDYIKLEK